MQKITIRFTRTDLSDGATETLTLVTLPEGETLYCDALDREERYAVLVEQGDSFAGLYDLDGDEVPSSVVGIRDTAPATTAPEDVIEQIASGWQTGTTSVERFAA